MNTHKLTPKPENKFESEVHQLDPCFSHEVHWISCQFLWSSTQLQPQYQVQIEPQVVIHLAAGVGVFDPGLRGLQNPNYCCWVPSLQQVFHPS